MTIVEEIKQGARGDRIINLIWGYIEFRNAKSKEETSFLWLDPEMVYLLDYGVSVPPEHSIEMLWLKFAESLGDRSNSETLYVPLEEFDEYVRKRSYRNP